MSADRRARRRAGTAPSLRLYRLSHAALVASHRGLLSLHSLTRAVVAGVWLGILDRDALLEIGDAFYAQHERYADDDYNLSGLWAWERSRLERDFAGRRRLLLVGAGAGREVIALARSGHEVQAYECNLALVEEANRHLSAAGLASRVRFAPPDTCPPAGGAFDGLIVGWGAYMLIAGRARRVALLRAMRAQAPAGAPLLLSFFVRPPGARRFVVVRGIGNLLRRLRGREPLELGDDLEPEYVHYFTRAELAAELAEGGFTLRSFAVEPYGHAVAVAT